VLAPAPAVAALAPQIAPVAPPADVAPAAAVAPEPIAKIPVMGPVAALDEPSLSPVVAPRGAAPRTKWLVAIAALGLASGVGLGLMVMRLVIPPQTSTSLAANPPSSEPAVVRPAAAALTPAVEARQPGAAPVTSAAEASPPPVMPAQPNAAAQSSAIPWDDLPQATTKSCEELAVVGPGPKGFLLQQAVTSAQRALLQGDTAAAHSAFCTAAQLGVPSDTVLLGLTQVLLMQSDLTAALKTVDQLLKRAPNNKKALDFRGDILIRMGRVDEAREAWFNAAGATRASKRLMDNLLRASDADGKTALRSGDLSRADRMLRRAIALTSGDPEHCRELVAVLTKNGQAAAAERWRSYLRSLDG
jgi:Flp pilus assembly protein TadD